MTTFLKGKSRHQIQNEWQNDIISQEKNTTEFVFLSLNQTHFTRRFWPVSVWHHGCKPNLQGPGSNDSWSGRDDRWVTLVFLLKEFCQAMVCWTLCKTPQLLMLQQTLETLSEFWGKLTKHGKSYVSNLYPGNECLKWHDSFCWYIFDK